MEEMREETPTQPRKTQRDFTSDARANLMDFVECFKKIGSGKVPKPIARLVEWFEMHDDKMWIVRNADNHLELAYDRPQLIQCFAGAGELDSARKTVQNFERCLNSVKPKLVVLESTHGKDVKRIGFAAPELIFGTQRTVVSQKVERQQSRRTKKQRLDD
jgi:hypothetical protein